MVPDTLNNLNMSFSTDLATLVIPRLRDNGSNWCDYLPKLQNAMGAKGLWRHVEGTASVPVLFGVSNGIPMLSDRKTPAMEDQIEAKESKLIEFKKCKYLACHILLSTTSTCLSHVLRSLSTK
jgi:hypothetical protein